MSPYRNRVTPDGEVVAIALRGAWTGNRGIIHAGEEIVRLAKEHAQLRPVALAADRLSRALGFWNRVHTQYRAKHQLEVVPGCMSSRTCMYFSPEVRSVLFPQATQ